MYQMLTGIDANHNKALSLLMAEAKSAGVPKDVIQRNIDKAKDKSCDDFRY